MKTTFFEPLTKGRTQCKFKQTCNLYSIKSYTCTHTGGSYCGKFRKLDSQRVNDRGADSEGLVEIMQ